MSASTAVCQYFIQGKCKFGAKCRNLHPGTQPNGKRTLIHLAKVTLFAAFSSLTGRAILSNNQYGQQRQQQYLTRPVSNDDHVIFYFDFGCMTSPGGIQPILLTK